MLTLALKLVCQVCVKYRLQICIYLLHNMILEEFRKSRKLRHAVME